MATSGQICTIIIIIILVTETYIKLIDMKHTEKNNVTIILDNWIISIPSQQWHTENLAAQL